MRPFLVIIFSFFSFLALAQHNSFEGSLRLKNNVDVSYSLEINIDSNYLVTGMSQVKTKTGDFNYLIEGNFDPETNFIYFKEEKTTLSEKDCPIFVQARISHLMQDIYVIAGIYSSQDSHLCGSGHINLVNRNFKFNLYNKKVVILPIENDSSNQAIMTTLLNQKVEEEKKFIDVTEKDNIEIKTKNSIIKMKIYDQMRIDQDKIRVYFNGKPITEMVLTERKAEFKAYAKKGENTLQVEALNEGYSPMNTSKFEIITDEKTYFFTNLLKQGQKAIYIITYE